MSTRPHPLDQVEIRFGVGGGVLLSAVIATGLAGLDDGYVFGVLLIATAVLGATVTRGFAALLGLAAWALVTGFVTNAYGQLTFARSDLELLAAFVFTALFTSHLAAVTRSDTRHRPADPRRAA